MHELSLALEVIRIAGSEADKIMAKSIHEIVIEVGDLSGVEADAFKSALELLSKDSVLDKARINIIRSTGKGRCKSCDHEFEMTNIMATCPKCQAFPSEIIGGQEFRVLSLVIE
jgi:hydrogenase nickel incorporation protein HypA/HybF